MTAAISRAASGWPAGSALAAVLIGVTLGQSSPGATTPGADRDVDYVDASVQVPGELLEWRFEDLEGDGTHELFLGVRSAPGARQLHVHRAEATAIAPQPFARIDVPPDAIAWTLVHLTADTPARRLVFLTRRAAWLVTDAVVDARRVKLADIDLLYDVPSPSSLPYWEYIVPTQTGDLCLLPYRSGFRLYGPDVSDVDAPPRWEASLSFESRSDLDGPDAPIDPRDGARSARDAQRDRRVKEARLARTLGDTVKPFLGSDGASDLLDSYARVQAPALVDTDGDGWLDLLHLVGHELRVYLGTPEGFADVPTRTERVPDYLRPGGRPAALRVLDLDGDGRVDVLGIWGEKAEVLENSEWRIFVMQSTKTALLPPRPNQVLRFKAGEFRVAVADIDGDRLPDLSVRLFEWPTALQTLTGLEFRYSQLLFPGRVAGGFARRPALRARDEYDQRSVQRAFANRVLAMDCSGDGVADLVEVGLDGALGVRRLERTESFVAATEWGIEPEPSRRFPARGSMSSLAVVDLNGDDLGDVVSATTGALHVYLSRRTAPR